MQWTLLRWVFCLCIYSVFLLIVITVNLIIKYLEWQNRFVNSISTVKFKLCYIELTIFVFVPYILFSFDITVKHFYQRSIFLLHKTSCLISRFMNAETNLFLFNWILILVMFILCPTPSLLFSHFKVCDEYISHLFCKSSSLISRYTNDKYHPFTKPCAMEFSVYFLFRALDIWRLWVVQIHDAFN